MAFTRHFRNLTSDRGLYRLRDLSVSPVLSAISILSEPRYKDENITIFSWEDDGNSYGPVLGKGKIGFRQMTPLIAEYSNLVVRKVEIA